MHIRQGKLQRSWSLSGTWVPESPSALYAGAQRVQATRDIAFRLRCAGGDNSQSIATTLVSPPLGALPDINSLQALLFHTPPSRPLPVDEGVYADMQQDPSCKTAVQHFTVEQSASKLARLFSSCLDAFMFGDTEQFTAAHINSTVLSILVALDGLLPAAQRIGFQLERDQGDTVSGMTQVSSKMRALRPDGVIRHRDQVRLLLKWEEKGVGNLADAVQDLKVKTAVWPLIYYGNLPYLLTFAAAGPQFQFYAVERAAAGSPTPIGPLLFINTRADRAVLAVAVVQLYRLLGAVAAQMPSHVAPVNKLITVRCNNITRSM